ncbi:MAG: SpoVA/SpoVAEb family sporulation membrane protein [Eubacterium sp.]|nr:SpoVA/SpoVAEb family sporulation membrane protein [Eubacterium sp.]
MLLMCIKAFAVGGLLCVTGQLLIDITKMTPARILVTFVCVGVILGGSGVYGKLIDFAGAGAMIPLTGFGCALAEGTKKAIEENGLTGVLTGPFTAMSGGVCVAVLSGLITALVTKAKDK